jgi:hypothetical protein
MTYTLLHLGHILYTLDVGHFLMMTSYEGLTQMLGFVATWTPHDVTGNLMMVFTLFSLLDDDMWPLEAFSMPLRA